MNTLVFIVGRNKRAIEDYFDNNQELEMVLRAKDKNDQANMVKNILSNGVKCFLFASLSGLDYDIQCSAPSA